MSSGHPALYNRRMTEAIQQDLFSSLIDDLASQGWSQRALFAPEVLTRELAAECDLVLVVGSPNSSNSNRLRELAERDGVESYLIDGADEIDPAWIAGRQRIGVTAGASAPDVLVEGVIARLRILGAGTVAELDGEPENMVFALPKELRLQLVE